MIAGRLPEPFAGVPRLFGSAHDLTDKAYWMAAAADAAQSDAEIVVTSRHGRLRTVSKGAMALLALKGQPVCPEAPAV
jgi:hypothetical protein